MHDKVDFEPVELGIVPEQAASSSSSSMAGQQPVEPSTERLDARGMERPQHKKTWEQLLAEIIEEAEGEAPLVEPPEQSRKDCRQA